MATSALPSLAAFYPETTQGTGPANAAAWVADGKRIRLIAESLDLSGFAEEMLADERSRDTINSDLQHIRGIKGGSEFPMESYLHGIEAEPASGSAVTATNFCTLLSHAMGGMRLGFADTAAALGAHSPTAVQVGTVANFAVGDWVGLEDSAGNVHHREVVSIAGSVLTLHRALPFTPADGAEVKACAVFYMDETVLGDSSGGHTFSWLLQKGLSGSRAAIEAKGCVSSISSIALARNAVAKIGFTTMCGSFVTPESAPDPSWVSNPTGAAGLVIGNKTKVFIQNVGTTTEATVHCVEFNVTPGITRTRVETMTEKDDGMPGTALYSLDPADCEIAAHLAPYASSHWTDFNNGQLKHVQFERNAAAGKSWSLYFPRVEIAATPQLGNANNLLSTQLKMRALQNTSATTTIRQSRMAIVLC